MMAIVAVIVWVVVITVDGRSDLDTADPTTDEGRRVIHEELGERMDDIQARLGQAFTGGGLDIDGKAIEVGVLPDSAFAGRDAELSREWSAEFGAKVVVKTRPPDCLGGC
jgi:hypothetical protein